MKKHACSLSVDFLSMINRIETPMCSPETSFVNYIPNKQIRDFIQSSEVISNRNEFEVQKHWTATVKSHYKSIFLRDQQGLDTKDNLKYTERTHNQLSISLCLFMYLYVVIYVVSVCLFLRLFKAFPVFFHGYSCR